MTGNISKTKGIGPQGAQGPQGPKGEPGAQGPRGPFPHIKFRYDASTGNLYCESDGIFTSDDYVGMRVESTEKLDELVEQGLVNVGVIYTVKDRVATNGCLVTGKFSDYFQLFRVTESGEPAYCFKEAIANYREYMVDYDSDDNANHLGGYIFNVDGTPACGGYIGLNIASGNVVSMLDGYDEDNPDAEVSFYICSENELEFSQEERAFYYNGESWVEVMTTQHIGDIDKALDAILDLDSKLLGGDA